MKKNKKKISARNQALINKFKFYLKVEKGLSQNSINSYINDIYRFVLFCNYSDIKTIGVEKVIDYINWLYKYKAKDTTVARKRSSLVNFYKFLFSSNLTNKPIYKKFPSPKIGRKLPNVLSINEINKLILSIDIKNKYGLRDRAIIEFLYSTGARISEMINFRLSDFIWENNLVKLCGKGGKERIIPISNIAKDYCQKYLENARGKFLKDKSNNIMFLNRFGEKLSRMGSWKIFKKYVKISQIKTNVSPHTLRHSFATHLLEGGANLRVVQALLGHTSINTTQIYTNIDRKYLKQIHSLYHPRP